MVGTATAELAAAVSEAGGLGLIGGTTGNNPDWLREQIRSVRNRTQKPFGVGFISSSRSQRAEMWRRFKMHCSSLRSTSQP